MAPTVASTSVATARAPDPGVLEQKETVPEPESPPDLDEAEEQRESYLTEGIETYEPDPVARERKRGFVGNLKSIIKRSPKDES